MWRTALFLLLLPFSETHVALTFPPARFPPLDFLDTARTQAPCGVPKPRAPIYSTYFVGETYNFTWRMQYPHQGGYRISLLDGTGQLVETLAPSNSLEFAGLNDQTSQSERVRFSRECPNCTLLLERQALEWGKTYQFRSCADVHVLSGLASDEERCSGHGRLEEGVCLCEGRWTGDVCQFMADCERDEQCGKGGRCVDEGSSLVRKTCFCPFGHFGKNCDQFFEGEKDECFNYDGVEEKDFDGEGLYKRECYQQSKLNDKDLILSRVVRDEVEVILDFASSSWVAIGWRPEGLDPSCRLFPDLEGVRSRRSADSSEEMEDVVEEGGGRPRNTSADWRVPPTRVSQDGPKPVMPRSNGILDSALKAPLHAMDCIDVVVGAVREGRLRIQDMYSRDRSTPLDDYWYEGELSLTAAFGKEVDGRTILMFRRPIQEIEPTDHPLSGNLFVVWAKGQTAGAYKHGTPSAVDGKGRFMDRHFYPDDVLKYHGSANRGVHPMELAPRKPLAKPPSEQAFGVRTATTAPPLSRLATTTSTEMAVVEEETESPSSSSLLSFSGISLFFLPMLQI